ncbi:glycine cleavage system aminomethyltransferase GcvT [Natronosporangium hydrolyticum]|uniref:aminomethyltransferase n=1 Tax=Natronosporangium hydrolyticum TaxID=2811111 RepID=A0A895YL22_9ACTN|nr:glycine cleavage system aminomethyltransferase GcvT [Natronosporangium hydrolyticum]QSB16199.1 glycine cleavage system aminomethyltransferase GcvT [Natronosporangium hydrolyticum]
MASGAGAADTTDTGSLDHPSGGGSAPLRSPLHDRHVALGAKFANFAGWEMPLEYAGGGVKAEHGAVRESVGIFDVSHLGKARITGPGAVEFVNTCLTNDLDRIQAGQAQLTHCCDEATGGVIDDMIAYRMSDEEIFLIPNAANTDEVVRRLAAAAPAGVTVAEEHADWAVLAVQGPASERVLDAVGLPADHDFMSFVQAPYGGGEVVVCRTGYTGEHGYEVVVPAGDAARVWDALFAAGEPYSLRPCGLGARDTLRTEMGYPLHGQDLSPSITSVQGRSGWLVGWSKPSFWGHEALRAERAAGPRRRLWGLEATGRGVPRPQMRVLVGEAQVGEVTSGTYSPTRQLGIALALLDTAAGLGEGDEVTVDVRGRSLPMRVVKPPFVTPSVR